jgi:hypothetical protein
MSVAAKRRRTATSDRCDIPRLLQRECRSKEHCPAPYDSPPGNSEVTFCFVLDPTAVLLILLVFSLQAVVRSPEPLEHALDEVLQCHLPCSMLFHGREVGSVTMWCSLAFGRGAKPGDAPEVSNSVHRIDGQ